jgi:glycosyltransferase involved in cell wall biosynthesis
MTPFLPLEPLLERAPLAFDPFSTADSETYPSSLFDLRVAIVHYWFVGRAGGERVVEALAEIFPQADIYALVADPAQLTPAIRARGVRTSFLQRIPGARRFHRHLLFLYPLALEQFDLSGYDLVISSDSGPAKGVITSSATCHVCYCHSPMRYIWDMFPAYKRSMGAVARPVFSVAASYMRLWDYASAGRVDYFVANSRFTASRIRKYYGRDSSVIYPPVCPSMGADPVRLAAAPGTYYLTLGRLVDYKRTDLAVEACTRLGRELRVLGDGPQLRALRRMAGPTVTFLGHLSDHEVRGQLLDCRALLFPGTEDFGIVPVEAQCCGKPVIAHASGGALESVRGFFPESAGVKNPTGVFFRDQSAEGLMQAMLAFESREREFRPELICEHASQFESDRFKIEIAQFVQSALRQFRGRTQNPSLHPSAPQASHASPAVLHRSREV